MTIRLSQFEAEDRNRFVSQHWVHTQAADEKQLITLTGIVLAHVKGTGSSWYRDELELVIRFPNVLPSGRWIRIEHWAPFITINAIYNRHHAVNAGWAVDEFWGPGRILITNGNPMTIHARIAIRDVDGWLYRVGYNVTLSGGFAEPPEPPE